MSSPPPGYTSTPPPGAGGPPPIPSPRALGGQHVLSGWWPRVGAQLIDGLIVVGAGVLLSLAVSAQLSFGFYATYPGWADQLMGWLFAILCVAIAVLIYAPTMMAHTNGRTLGRMATGIRVVRADGKPIGFGFATLREVVVKGLLFGLLSTLAGVVYIVDVLWPLWDEENRALHDFVVNTRTIEV
jgi:uncharacterized RDD family membrane protein YckC